MTTFFTCHEGYAQNFVEIIYCKCSCEQNNDYDGNFFREMVPWYSLMQELNSSSRLTIPGSMQPKPLSFVIKEKDGTPFTHNELETHGFVISTLANDVLVPKHQDISTHSADLVFILPPNIHTKKLYLLWTIVETKITFWKKSPSCLKVNTLLTYSCRFFKWNKYEYVFQFHIIDNKIVNEHKIISILNNQYICCWRLGELINWGWVKHIYISKLGHHWFRKWLVAWLVPSH